MAHSFRPQRPEDIGCRVSPAMWRQGPPSHSPFVEKATLQLVRGTSDGAHRVQTHSVSVCPWKPFYGMGVQPGRCQKLFRQTALCSTSTHIVSPSRSHRDVTPHCPSAISLELRGPVPWEEASHPPSPQACHPQELPQRCISFLAAPSAHSSCC